jgi:hypothetical protein
VTKNTKECSNEIQWKQENDDAISLLDSCFGLETRKKVCEKIEKIEKIKIGGYKTLENLKKCKILKGLTDHNLLKNDSNTESGFKYCTYEKNSEKYVKYT